VTDPEVVDRYQIKDVLGKGAMGSVYLAWDPKLHRDVAIKVVSGELARDTKARERFNREARAIAALKHSNIVEIYDYAGSESEDLFLVMEKLDGDDLFNIINDKGVTPEPCAAAVGHELCLALQVAHDAGIIHRDMKPENVFMNAAGRVVLTDFGVVKAIREDSAVDGWSQKTDVIGTPGFMAPELMMNRSLGPRTDLFALGALLYNISTGELPFDGGSPVEMFRAAVAGEYTDPRRYNRLLSEEFCDVLDGCLQAKPKKRFRSAEQLRDALKGVLEINGVADLRDDLRDYMRDPVGYAHMTRRRTTSYLLQRLKVAVKDRDEGLANKIRDRLNTIDPENDEVQSISGVIVNDAGHISMRPHSSAQTMTRSGARFLYMLAGILAGVAVILAGYLILRRDTPVQRGYPGVQVVEQTEPVPPRPAVARSDTGVGTVVVAVKGGIGKLYINKKYKGKVARRPLRLKLDPGEYIVEIRARGRTLRETIVVDAGKTVAVAADLKRRKIKLK
jgi:serine/threonine-protein kinase